MDVADEPMNWETLSTTFRLHFCGEYPPLYSVLQPQRITLSYILSTQMSSSWHYSRLLGASKDSREDGQIASSVKWKDWIRSWRRHQGRFPPAPCSADELGVVGLKGIALQSLTVDNTIDEVFSSFSMVHDDVRKEQVKFFLNIWVTVHGLKRR